MLSLEHFKLLKAKTAGLHRGSGGMPEVTVQEVADLLATLDYEVSVYARLIYGQEWHLNSTLGHILLRQIKPEDSTWPDDHYLQIIQMVIGAASTNYDLTASQKANVMGKRWWSRSDEEDHKEARGILDIYDSELRHALAHWNDVQRETTT
jgi:hypothetical protein